MAELTHLDEKLAEVLGLAQAAQVASKKVVTLARKEKETELVELMTRMGDEAAQVEQTLRYHRRHARWHEDRHRQEGPGDQGRGHRIHEDLPPRRPGA